MPYKIRISEIANDMKKEGIKGHSKVTVENYREVLLSFVLEMIEKRKIRPYNKTCGGTYTFGRLCNFEKLFKIPTSKKEIIGKALKGEGEGLHYNRNDNLYCFRKYPHYKLPSSAWNHVYEGVLYKWNDRRINLDDARHVYIIYKLEESILKHGLKQDKPLLIRFYETPDETPKPHFDLKGGNHRLQALRNLVRYKKLKRETLIPCIIYKRR